MPDNSKQHGKASGGLIALAAVLALGLGAAAWWLAAGEEAFGGALGSLASPGQTDPAPVPTALVTRGNIEKTISGTGEVKGSASERLKPASWRYFKSFDAPLNKLVRAGEPLMTYTSGEVMSAPYDLVVKSRTVPKAGEALSPDDHFAEVERMDTVHVEMPVAESDLASLAEGQEVDVVVGSQGTRTGAISNISQVGAYQASGSKFTVTVEVPNDGSIWLGMSATLSVKVAQATDVLTVPVSAVQGDGDAKTVTVREPDGSLRTVGVSTGLSDGSKVEVAGEISEGDAVVLHESAAMPGGSAGDTIVTMTETA